MSEELGLSKTRKDDFSEWYLEVVRKGDFIDQRSPIKGFDVITPWGYAVWEQIQSHFDSLLKARGISNAYFPLFIPEHLIKKEEEHFEGFKAEAFCVTEAGGKPLEERLYVRPTSETIMYYMYALWLRSHKDLPLRINQWNNVVRFDTKVTKPFIRGREFLWQEGHTAHETQREAEEQVHESLDMYKQSAAEQAMEPLILVRPKSDTFAGANYTVVMDFLTQDGRVVQGCDAHMLGQHFSKPFNIKFMDKNEKEQHVWQTSWGMSTRQLGIIIMQHGDDHGAVLPPDIAPYQVVVVPIPFKGHEKSVNGKATKISDMLKSKHNIRVFLDNRDYSPGFKFNHWELRGVPLRIEIGPKDIENKEITIVRRLDGKKEKLNEKDLDKIKNILGEIQEEMLEKSRNFLKNNIRDVSAKKELKNFFGFAR